MTRPFEALEGARRERIELEKRSAQEKAKLHEEREQKNEAAQAKGEAKRGAPPSSPAPTR
jgi:hypothetical protein